MKTRRRARALPLSLVLVLGLSASSFGLTINPASPQDAQPFPRVVTTARPEPPVHSSPITPDAKSARPDVGTVDAPVDGLDGKPHAGPFVDPVDTSRKPPDAGRRTSADLRPKVVDKPVAEDGVMNDPSRTRPKEGTTGTEGGVTEKERNRMIKEGITGEKAIKRPDSPREGALLDREQMTATKDSSLQATDASFKRADAADENRPKGFAGLEKPTNLPEKPHNIPHPVPGNKATDTSSDPVEVDSPTRGSDVDHQEDEEGAHDIIPWDSLFGSFSSIAATEIGDKTFIVAALMAMRHSRLQVFSAAFSALFIMTILSGLAGHAVGALISKRWSALVAALLFLVFGAKSLREGFEMSASQGVSDEIREVEAELEEKEVDMARQARRASTISPYALEAGRAATTRRPRSRSHLGSARRSPSPSSSRSPSPSKPAIVSAISGIKNLFSLLLSPAWVETFSMTFVGELGDRSQIATVAMAAGQEYFWVMVGASLGHFVCTGIAVVGGSVLAGRVSLRKVTLIGGAIFIAFGVFTLIEAAQYWM